MACWSAENATKAYLKTMKMGEFPKEPNGAEYISALAAGNNAQLIVVTCAATADSTTLALAAAAQQTGGRVVCILSRQEDLMLSQNALRMYASIVEFIVGNGHEIQILNQYYNEADFLALDCNLENHEEILKSVEESRRENNTIVLGYNAFCKDSWKRSNVETQLLPIGEGLLVSRILAASQAKSMRSKRSNWIVKVDSCTGEEHVFRVRPSTQRRSPIIQA